MNETTFRIVELTVKLLAAVLATYVVPTAARWIRQQLIQTEIGKAVLAAQQTLWAKSGMERKEFAMKAARAALDELHISMSDEQLSLLIEAAVQEMHISKGDYPEELRDDKTADN
nr:MAG TPA: holin [Caudoviricetes sp.]